MTRPLWAKAGSDADAQSGDKSDAMSFMSRDDVLLDRELFEHDIRATRAHVRGLASIDLLTRSDAEALDHALADLAEDYKAGGFVLDTSYEDGHTAIESYLVGRVGETGKRVHLGRSRNDQVAVALRLYMLDALDRVKAALIASARAALSLARAEERTPMPGYTHLQRAVPSTVGLWMGSFAESFADAAELCVLTRRWIDSCPLGTAAGYGVNVPLPREQVAEELGFARVQINPMSAQASRGRIEAQVVSVLWQAMQEVRRLAWDLSLFSTEEFGFVTLGPGFVTGSSIMPNKKNPDMAELLRGSAAVVGGALAEIQQVVSLPSGYHRDLQLTKPPLIRVVKVTLEALWHIPRLIETCTLHPERMKAAIDRAMLATDRAVELSTGGLPFRDAYRQAAAEIGDATEIADAGASIDARVSLGGCANLGLDQIEARLRTLG
ncbi:MAG: argininosuccinate lyase [Phycisphaeraceae bacterium]|nr:MAG: argininosuccinate lyase [Phycisphaeraceae bacterium]